MIRTNVKNGTGWSWVIREPFRPEYNIRHLSPTVPWGSGHGDLVTACARCETPSLSESQRYNHVIVTAPPAFVVIPVWVCCWLELERCYGRLKTPV